MQKVTKKSSLSFVMVLLIIYILAWYLQSRQLFSWDVSWLAEASRRLMLGGNYTNDFFENNPPLILYLYMPPVSIAYWLNINIIEVMRFYVFAIAATSMGLCYYFSDKIFNKEQSFTQYIATLLACIYLILPFYEFGQREHLFLMLTMPYLFMMIVRLNNGTVNRKAAIITGILAGLGFLIKPIFLLTFILIESYYYFYNKCLRCCIRPETITISIMVTLYAWTIIFWHSDYLINVLPYASRWTYVNINMPWEVLFFNPYLTCCLTTALLAGFYINGSYKMAYRTLTIALVGAIGIFLFQQSIWYYRVLPMLSLSALLLGCILFQICKDGLSVRIKIILSLFSVAIYANIFYYALTPFVIISHHPIMHIVYWCFLLVFLFQRKNIMIIFFSFILFLPMFCFSSEMYLRGVRSKQYILAMANYFDKHFYNKKIYSLSTDLTFLPVFNYSIHSSNVSRFSHMLGLGGLVTSGKKARQDKNYLIHLVAEDIDRKKPDVILVDIGAKKRSIGYIEMINHQINIRYLPFDYVSDFSSHASFQQVWKAYRYKNNTADGKFAVYEKRL